MRGWKDKVKINFKDRSGGELTAIGSWWFCVNAFIKIKSAGVGE